MDKTQYFSIPHVTNINVEPMAETASCDIERLMEEIPPLFLMASELSPVDSSVIRGINGLGDSADGLFAYLQQQSRKIDAILGFILGQQDDPELRFQTRSLGASGLSYSSDTPLPLNSKLKLKIFIPEESLAIFCYATVDNCSQQDNCYLIDIRYETLREEDEEQLIKATLHLQTRMLKQAAEQRKNTGE